MEVKSDLIGNYDRPTNGQTDRVKESYTFNKGRPYHIFHNISIVNATPEAEAKLMEYRSRSLDMPMVV